MTNTKEREKTQQDTLLLEQIYKGEKYVIFDSIKNKVHIIPDKKFKEIIEGERQQAIAEERERVVGEIAHREMKYWINVFDSTPVRKIPLEADNIAKNFARIEVARWNKVLANK